MTRPKFNAALSASNVIPTADSLGASRSAARAEAVLRERIETGVYPPRQWLPAERALAAELGVHRGAVRMAIDRLASDGLIQRNARCRPVVSWTSHNNGASEIRRRPAVRRTASKFIALIMGHGGFEHGPSVQQ
ncbi:MAG TPA: winged helix-turn-helix domain-containing protein, partial [Capsulimonadaceae bacterium]|nr:winged helix-turn-helix domain-containing protein [Capsulimonadaceae bacterium]